MALNSMGLGITLSARDEASAVLRKINGNFNDMGAAAEEGANRARAAMTRAAAGAGFLAAGLAGIAAAFRIAKPAGEFEQGLAAVRVITRASVSDLETLRRSAIDAGLATQFSPSQAVEGLRVLGQAGLNANDSMQALLSTLDLAAGGSISIKQAASTTVGALKAFGIESDKSATAVDRMFRVTQTTQLAVHELESALANISRGANSAHQSLEEMLPAIGLVRNTGLDASTAATSISSALIFASKNAEKFNKIGIQVTDATGKFKPFLDIVRESSEALSGIQDDAVRSAKITELFSRFGQTAFVAIERQLKDGVKDLEGNLLRGADAVAYLREQMATAEGQAKEFREALLNTFEGQKTLLGGISQTLQVVIGEGFARVLRPIVSGLAKATEAVTRFVDAIPDSTKDTFAKIALAVSGLALAVGSLLAFKVGIVVFGAALKFVGVTLGLALLKPILLVTAAVGGLMLVFSAFRSHSRQVGGGIVGFFSEMFGKVKLFFGAIQQLFSEGGFSGAVRSELNAAENGGVKAFAIKTFMWIGRIKNFFTGLSEGFGAAIDRARPVFDTFVGVLKEFAGLFGVSATGAKQNAAAWDSAGQVGRTFGDVLGVVASLLTSGLTVALRVAGLAVMTFKFAWDVLGPIVSAVGGLITSVVQTVVGLLAGDWDSAWRGAANIVLGVVEVIMSIMAGLVKGIAGAVDLVAGMFGKDLGLRASISRELDGALAEFQAFADGVSGPSIAPAFSVAASSADAGSPLMSVPNPAASSPALESSRIMSKGIGRVAEASVSAGQAVMSSVNDNMSRPIELNTTIKVDNEVLARARQRKEKSDHARGFSGRSREDD